MRLFLFVLLLASLAGLDACTPAYESVAYTLPPTAGGRQCARQCLEAQDYCHQTCDIEQRTCVMKVQAQAISDYDKYTREQFFSRQPIELSPSDFERQTPCNNGHRECGAACDRPYQTCYQDCGGTVSVTSSCQFLCF
jgi:hypothetical protein